MKRHGDPRGANLASANEDAGDGHGDEPFEGVWELVREQLDTVRLTLGVEEPLFVDATDKEVRRAAGPGAAETCFGKARLQLASLIFSILFSARLGTAMTAKAPQANGRRWPTEFQETRSVPTPTL